MQVQEVKSTKTLEVLSLVSMRLEHKPSMNARVKMMFGKEVMVKAKTARDVIECACLLDTYPTKSQAWKAAWKGLQDGARNSTWAHLGPKLSFRRCCQ